MLQECTLLRSKSVEDGRRFFGTTAQFRYVLGTLCGCVHMNKMDSICASCANGRALPERAHTVLGLCVAVVPRQAPLRWGNAAGLTSFGWPRLASIASYAHR